MNRPGPQLESARRLLEHEGARGTAEECARAAGIVYDKLHARLDPLLGAAGVQALFVRSAQLTHGQFSVLDTGSVEGAAKLCERLRALEPAEAMDAAVALFGSFFTLITTFIGDRLTIQVLRSAWPTIADTAFMETEQ